jgi:phosphatidylglycerophosphate synthase
MKYKYKKLVHKNVRKLPYNLENPIDNFLVDFADTIDPAFKKAGFTPNGITTLSLITGILMNYLYYHNYYYSSAAMALSSYFFDCMDGNFARKYNMVTDFGDTYDHIKDILVLVVLLLLFFQKKISRVFKMVTILILIILVLFAIYHMACQERFIKKHKNLIVSKYLNNLTQDCKDTTMQYSRYLGCGTFYLVLVLVIISHQYIK